MPEIPYPHPEVPDDGLILNVDPDGTERLFTAVHITGLTRQQVAALHHYADAMRLTNGQPVPIQRATEKNASVTR